MSCPRQVRGPKPVFDLKDPEGEPYLRLTDLHLDTVIRLSFIAVLLLLWLFIEKVSPALEHVDSSSGAMGTAVNHAIEELVATITKAPVELSQ